jgi:Papain-like cysteine protease AvrRpt2
MPEYINPSIKKYCVNQKDQFTCWAAVAETMRRYKQKSTPRTSFGAYLGTLKNKGFRDCYELGTQAGLELTKYPTIGAANAVENVRNRSAQFNSETPSGLPAGKAYEFFCDEMKMNFVPNGGGAGQVDTTDAIAFMKYIKKNAPLIVFNTKPYGHLRIIIGYWYDSEEDQPYPQIIMFDPENVLKSKYSYPNFLWAHFREYFVDGFADGCDGFFHW